MAKVIRNKYVFRPHNRWHRYLPRRNDGVKQYDYEENLATPSTFPDPAPGEPPKLWLAWLYRQPTSEPRWIKESVERLFGKNATPGRLHIFKNTSGYNNELWQVKHLIELKPVSFPNGEPTENDIGHMEVLPDGRCIVDKSIDLSNAAKIQLHDPLKQFTPKQLSKSLKHRYNQCKDVYQDNVYTPKNISVVD
uniref:39S ribosomal protein L30, mitochondrial n=1 Tax=Panagrellus redivivus TaxID=6233 RepID=A0A7E4US65_PANRE